MTSESQNVRSSERTLDIPANTEGTIAVSAMYQLSVDELTASQSMSSDKRWARWMISLAVLSVVAIPPTLAQADDKNFSLNLQIGRADDLSRAFHEAAKRVRPSVVSIATVQRSKVVTEPTPTPHPELPGNLPPFFDDDFIERFFGQRIPRRSSVRRGLGTGVIVRSDGFIVTNHHVIDEADELTVRLDDGREFGAELVGTDSRSEVAVIRIEAQDLVAAQFGDSDDLQVGQWVIAVGNPFQLAQTVTVGVISAKGRSNVGITDYENFIQTDAAINPGNSGGPLLTLRGRVIGINTAIASRTGSYMGIGFAIPSNMVQRIMNRLIEHGHVDRGLLGTIVQELTPQLAHSFGFSGTDGVLVADVAIAGPAEAAGIQSGDIITHLDDKPVKTANELRNLVAEYIPGTQVEVQYVRDGIRHRVQVELAALDGDQTKNAPNKTPVTVSSTRLGMKVEPLTPEYAERLGYPDRETGVVVSSIEPAGPADNAGLLQGDLIVAVNGKPISSIDEFESIIAEVTGEDGIRMKRLRDGTHSYIFVRPPKRQPATESGG